MLSKLSREHFRWLAIVAAGGTLHLLLLCAPVTLVGRSFGGAARPRILAFLVVATAWLFVESLASATGGRLPLKSQGPRGLPLLIGITLLLTFWISLTDAAISAITPLGYAAIAGSTLMLAGVALRVVSLRTLGPFFLNEVALVPGQPLVTHGIYASLRHPSETGTLCLALGGALLLGSVCGALAVALLLLPCLIWRTRLEDKMLRQHYRAEFGRYAREVPAFLPCLRLTARGR